jgi:anaerobic magnesium-protoporphyrin IX monomethyl ester cyclase
MTHRTRVDLVLVNPGGRHRVFQALGASLAAVEPPIWAGLMATFVRRHGYRVAVVDANAEDLGPDDAADQVLAMAPRLVAVVVYGHQPSASTQNMPAAGAICAAIKNRTPEQPVLILGGHVAALPERTLREESADFAAQGEGLYTLVDLLEALETSPSPDLTKVRDLVYRDGGAIRRGPAAPLVTALDAAMPGIAWDLLPMNRSRAHNWHCFGLPDRQPYAAIYTTLGCPYRCAFCCIQAPFKSGEKALGLNAETNSYRRWRPKTVLTEIDTLVRAHGVRHIKIADELFVLNPTHVHGICDGLIERGYDLNIWAYARVDSVKDDMLEKLKRAGVNWLAFGIEAASERVRADAQKGFAQDKIVRIVNRVRSAGIHIIGNYIFGLPEDTLDTMQATLDLALELNCEFANFYCTMAYPGSRLYQHAVREGQPLPRNWGAYSQHSADCLPLPTRTSSGDEVLAFRDKAFQRYFSDPGYLAMLERTFDATVRAEVERMTAQRLVRERCVRHKECQ